ncbi:unnamed protein product, partial [Ectocarpus fasciculatus]
RPPGPRQHRVLPDVLRDPLAQRERRRPRHALDQVSEERLDGAGAGGTHPPVPVVHHPCAEGTAVPTGTSGGGGGHHHYPVRKQRRLKPAPFSGAAAGNSSRP